MPKKQGKRSGGVKKHGRNKTRAKCFATSLYVKGKISFAKYATMKGIKFKGAI